MRPDPAAEFSGWFVRHGGFIHPHAQLVQSPHGFSLRSHQPIPAGERIITCPHACTISFADIPPTMLDSSLPPEVNLCRFLVHEKQRGSESFWSPYLHMLPETFETPVWWNSQDLLWLAGTNLGKATELRLEKYRAEADSCAVSWPQYLWAASVLASRAFPSLNLAKDARVTKALVPGLDLLNHSPDARVEWQWGKETCCIKTAVDLAAGVEIYNNYGPKTDEELLAGYGIILENNVANKFLFRLTPGALDTVPDHILAQIKDDPSMHWVRPRGTLVDFSPSLIHLSALVMASPRELEQKCPLEDETLPPKTWTRNKYKVVIFLMTLLETSSQQIRAFDLALNDSEIGRIPAMNDSDKTLGDSATPTTSQRQKAARYRQNQLDMIEQSLQNLTGMLPTQSPQIWTLESIMKICPEFEEMLIVGYQTTKPSELRARGAEIPALALWLRAQILDPNAMEVNARWRQRVLDWFGVDRHMLRRLANPNDKTLLQKCVHFVEEESIDRAIPDGEEALIFVDLPL